MNRVGIGTRVVNCLVDTGLIFLLSYIAFKVWRWYVFHWHFAPYNFGWFFWGILFIYYFLFESISKGRTPGKWLSFSKAVNENGKRPNIGQVFIRSLIRVTLVDLFFYPFLEKTLHDYLSKTDVVEA